MRHEGNSGMGTEGDGQRERFLYLLTSLQKIVVRLGVRLLKFDGALQFKDGHFITVIFTMQVIVGLNV